MATAVTLATFLEQLEELRDGFLGAVSTELRHHVLSHGSELAAVAQAREEASAAIVALPGHYAVDFGKDVLVMGPGRADLGNVEQLWSGPTGVAALPWPLNGYAQNATHVLYMLMCCAADVRRTRSGHARAANDGPTQNRQPHGEPRTPFGLPVTAGLDQLLRSCRPTDLLNEALAKGGPLRCVLTDVHGFAYGIPAQPGTVACIPELALTAARAAEEWQRTARHGKGRTGTSVSLPFVVAEACHRRRIVQQARLERHLTVLEGGLRRLGADSVWRTGGDGLLAVGAPTSLSVSGLEELLAAPIKGHLSGAAAVELRADADISAGLAWLQLWVLWTKAAVKAGRPGCAVGDPAVDRHTGAPFAARLIEVFASVPAETRQLAAAALREAGPYVLPLLDGDKASWEETTAALAI